MSEAWDFVKVHINDKPIGTIVCSDEFIDGENITSKIRFDMYFHFLSRLGVLEKIGLKSYKIMSHIPIKMTSGMIYHFVDKHDEGWKDWFLTLEDRVEEFFK